MICKREGENQLSVPGRAKEMAKCQQGEGEDAIMQHPGETPSGAENAQRVINEVGIGNF